MKNRFPFLETDWQPRIHEYLGGIVKGLDGHPQAIGGVADHVHLLVGLKSTHCLADFMRDLKKSSSLWIESTFNLSTFAWQEGYAAFTVSPSARDRVKNYIRHQPEHHRMKTSREELLEFLQRAGIEYDTRFFE